MTTNYRTAVSDAILNIDGLTILNHKSGGEWCEPVIYMTTNSLDLMADWMGIFGFLNTNPKLSSTYSDALGLYRVLRDNALIFSSQNQTGQTPSVITSALRWALRALISHAATGEAGLLKFRQLLAPFDAHYYEHHGKFLEAQQ